MLIEAKVIGPNGDTQAIDHFAYISAFCTDGISDERFKNSINTFVRGDHLSMAMKGNDGYIVYIRDDRAKTISVAAVASNL